MYGTVIEANLCSAFLLAPGVSRPVLAPFSGILNATPKTLDFAEIVEFTLKVDGETLRAKDMRILAGKSERKALEGMSFHASGSLRRGNDTGRWSRDKDSGKPQRRAGIKRSGKGGHFVRDRFAVIEPDAP